MAFIFVWFLPTTGEIYSSFSRYGIQVFPATTISSIVRIPVEIVMFSTSDAVGSVTWFEPPPVETVTDPTLVHTNRTKLRKGSTNVYLNWEFSVTSELNLVLVTLKLDGASVGTIVPSTGDAAPSASFTSRFNVSWVAQHAALSIFNVTTADEGLFTCELNTFEGATNRIWSRNIDVSVVGKNIIC